MTVLDIVLSPLLFFCLDHTLGSHIHYANTFIQQGSSLSASQCRIMKPQIVQFRDELGIQSTKKYDIRCGGVSLAH